MLTIPRMNVVLLDAARVTAQRVTAGTADEAGRLELELAGMSARMRRETEHLRRALPEYSQPAADIDRAFGVLMQASGEVRQAVQGRQGEQARALMRGKFGPQFDRLRRYFEALGGQLAPRMREEAREAERATGRVLRRTLLAAVLALAGALVAGQLWVWRSIGRPMQGLVTVVRRLMAGDTSVTIPGGGRSDEVGLLASALGVFRQNLVRKQRPRTRSGRTSRVCIGVSGCCSR